MEASPSAVTLLEFLDPEMLAAAIRDASLEPCQLSARPAPSMIARLRCPRICLDLVSVGPAMAYRGAMPRDCYTLTFVVECPERGHSFNFDTEFGAGYLGFFPPGASLDAAVGGGASDAILTVPVAEFHDALAIHFPEIPDRVLEQGAGMRVGPAAQQRLRKVLAETGEVIRERENRLADPLSCCRLERRLLPVFIAALRSGCEAIIPPPKQRIAGRYRRLRQARDFIADRMHEPIQVGDLCVELGLSERGLENLFNDFLGLSPCAFLRSQRLHGVRRTLLERKPAAGVVKEAALEAGFWHLGRFAGDYRRLFGESPSQTLALDRRC